MDKCANCGKARDQHHAKDAACPIGKRHRVYGYTQFQHLVGDYEQDSSKMYKRSFDSPEIGCAYIHEGKPVYVIDGCMTSGGRVSNWWTFQPINKDGTLGKQQSCYGYEFTEKIKCKVMTKVQIDWNRYQDLDL
jgi:hypothetical protein